MNRAVKFVLVLLGIILISYAIFVKTFVIHSPLSAWENTLMLYVNRGDDDKAREFFKSIISGIESYWNPVIIFGLLIVLAALFVKTNNREDKR